MPASCSGSMDSARAAWQSLGSAGNFQASDENNKYDGRRSSMSGTTSRIALAGFGAWGQMHARAIDAIDGATVVSVYCHSEASENAAAELLPAAHRFRDYAGMLAAGGFDVVDVTVPNHVHA